MTDWATAQYELRVDTDPDADGYYAAFIYANGVQVECKVRDDRSAAIQAAREWVAWRRSATGGTETISL